MKRSRVCDSRQFTGSVLLRQLSLDRKSQTQRDERKPAPGEAQEEKVLECVSMLKVFCSYSGGGRTVDELFVMHQHTSTTKPPFAHE